MARESVATSGPAIASGSRVVLVVSRGPSPEPRSAAAAMPGVIGQQQGTALQRLQSTGFNTQVFNDFSGAVRRGHVIDQYPQKGTTAALASGVVLLVSNGPAAKTSSVSFPDAVGLPEEEAVARMRAAGLEPEVAREHHGNVAEGVVIAQLPSQSTLAAQSRSRFPLLWLWIAIAVLVLIGAGAAAYAVFGGKRVTVPNVTGQTQSRAEKTIASAGLRLGKVTFQTGSDAAEGTVLSQSPQSGTTVRSGGSVSIVVATLKAKVAVPGVVGMSSVHARQAIASAGLIAHVTRAYSTSIAKDLVISQAPAAGAEVDPGSAVTISVSRGPQTTVVTLPDLVGMTRSDAANQIASLGLTAQIANAYSSSVATGTISGQTPTAGQALAPGTAVGLTVSIGVPPSNAVTLPNLEGQSTSNAVAGLAALGLSSTRVTQNGTGQPAGTIAAQAPSAGQLVAPGATVVLFVSSGN